MEDMSTDQKREIRIFISYAGTDRDAAHQFQNALEQDVSAIKGDLNSQKYADFHITALLHESEKSSRSGGAVESPLYSTERKASTAANEDEGWKHGVQASIHSSQVVLLVQGDTTADRKKVWWEIKLALKEKKPVIVCQMKNYDLPWWLIEKKLTTPFGDWVFPFIQSIVLGKAIDRFVCFPLRHLPPSFLISFHETAYAKVFSLEETDCIRRIRREIIRIATKQYDIFSDNAEKLFECTEKQTWLFEQYKMYLKSSEDLLDRRQKLSDFFLAINTALMTFIGVVVAFGGMSGKRKAFVIGLSVVAGFGFNDVWCRQIDRLKIINTAKLRMIQAIERHLPLCLYREEYTVMTGDLDSWQYRNSSADEKKIPHGFNFLYLLIVFAYMLLFGWNRIGSFLSSVWQHIVPFFVSS